MSDPGNPPETEKGKSRELTFAEAAKRVQRTVVELVDGKGEDGMPAKQPREKHAAVQAGEVLVFKAYGGACRYLRADQQRSVARAVPLRERVGYLQRPRRDRTGREALSIRPALALGQAPGGGVDGMVGMLIE